MLQRVCLNCFAGVDVLKRFSRTILSCVLVVLLAGCVGGDHSDIDKFIAEARSKPQGVIDPIPVFKPYKAFRYNAASKRAPFDIPVQAQQIFSLYQQSDVKPDNTRVKEQLEEFPLESLSMVGTLERNGQLWGLIDDGNGKEGGGSVHQVLVGNFVGRNHGRIVEISADSIGVIEIVSNGPESWVERPRTINLREASLDDDSRKGS